MNSRAMECIVGLFVIAAMAALLVLAFNVSGIALWNKSGYYDVSMEFDNIGDLKERAPVTIGGVKIGRVQKISLDKTDFRAKVQIQVKNGYLIPMDSSASILTQGLLGSNYIGIAPGFSPENIQPNGDIITTHSALILENLIGQLMYSLTNTNTNSSKTSAKGEQHAS